jgi:hypothetical protein
LDVAKQYNRGGQLVEDILKTKKRVVDNETFIDIMRVAQEDNDIRKKLTFILKLDSFNRQSLLNTWLNDLKLQGAPKKLREALSAFLDDAVAEKALEVIDQS